MTRCNIFFAGLPEREHSRCPASVTHTSAAAEVCPHQHAASRCQARGEGVVQHSHILPLSLETFAQSHTVVEGGLGAAELRAVGGAAGGNRARGGGCGEWQVADGPSV